MKKFEGLLFDMVPIPAGERGILDDVKFVSPDGTSCRRYLLYLSETCQVTLNCVTPLKL